MAKVFQTAFKEGSLIDKYSGNNFTLAAAAAFAKTEKGLGLNLPQVNGYAYTTLPTIFTNIGTTNFSISLYCKINTTDPNWSGAIFNAGSTAVNEVMLWLYGGKIELTVCDAAAAYYSKKATTAYKHGQWYHIIITWVAATNTVALYIDGVLNDIAGTGTNGAATSNLTLGSQTTYAWQTSTNCTFGEVAIYDHILTATERVNLYSEFLKTYPIQKGIEENLEYPKPTDLSNLVYSRMEADILDGFNVTDAAWTHDCMTGYPDYNYLSMTTGEYIKTDTIVLKQGSKYRCFYNLQLASASNLSFRLKDFDLANTYHTWTYSGGVVQEGFFDFTATTVSGTGIGFDAANAGSVYLFSLQIFELTGLVAAYNMISSPDGVLMDISGEGYNGTIAPGIISTDKGLFFNGGSTVEIGAGFDDKLDSTQEWTIAIRFNGNKTPTEDAAAISNGTHNISIGVDQQWMKYWAGYYDGSNYQRLDGPAFSINKWIDIVLINHSGFITAYFNGVSGSTSIGAILSGNVGTRLGAKSTFNGFFNGEVSDVKIFNYAFSEQEAIAYHNSFAKQISQRHSFDSDGVGSTI